MRKTVELGGWRYCGDILPPGGVAVETDAPADITVTVTAVPAAPEDSSPGHPLWRNLTDGRILLSVPGIGRFCLSGGDRVDVEPAAGADPVSLGLLLSGPVLAVLNRQRGLLPFDGAALGLNGGALLIVGASGVGKSTLAAVLAQQGWPVLADGVVSVSSRKDGAELIRGAPCLRLWRRSARMLGLNPEEYPPLRPGVPRFDTQWDGLPPRPRPITGIAILLNRAARPECERLSPGQAVACLTRALWSRPAYAEDRPGAAALITDLAALTSSAPCWRLTLAEDLGGLTPTADLLKQSIGL
ncbi:phosphoenolpyruvate carboxykinase (ATP) [Novispirillum itersonii]|uniref:Hpr(Ser) kinase/phosphatase n=1 Tax=Novispirillum itersonii TaxID=189 RepID=A0A7W9ZHR8_NOVIT|nr:serine kinase [Novispirillum itersonii]MBB6211701.1 hypothetical protein [Novispirillum itersonii]